MSFLLLKTLFFCSILGALCGLLGNILIARRMALITDMLGHALLPGIILGFFLASFEKNIFWLLLGAFLAALCAQSLYHALADQLRIKKDAAIALILAGFYGIGVLGLAWIQDLPGAQTSGLEQYLLGQASTLSDLEGLRLLVLFLLSLVSIILFYKEFKSLSFDPQFSKSSGIAHKRMLLLLNTLIALSVFSALQTVGIVLACAFFIIPAATATFWSARWRNCLLIGTLLGMGAGALGAFLSYAWDDTPTGPTIILCAFSFFVFSLFFGKHKGLLHFYFSKRKQKTLRIQGDFLKALFSFEEKNHSNPVHFADVQSLMDLRSQPRALQAEKICLKKDLVQKTPQGSLKLSAQGRSKAMELVRKHRLWELYLVQKLHFDPRKVHSNAEVMEHFLSPEISNELEENLRQSQKDPHGRLIPSQKDLRKLGVPGY